MGTLGFTGTVANIYPAAFMQVYVRDTTSNKWQTLGAISNGVLNIADFSSADSLTRNNAINALNFTAKCNMMQSSNTVIKLMPALCNGTNDFLFKLSDAATPAGGATVGWVCVTAAQVGVKAKLVASGTPDTNRHIELEWQGTIFKSSANQIALMEPTLTLASQFASTSDSGTAVFYAIGTYTAATDGGSPTISQIRSCGVSTLTLDTSGTSSPTTMAPIQNVKFEVDMLATADGIRRFLPIALNADIEFHWMPTLNADLITLHTQTQKTSKSIITFLDGTILTFDGQTGIEANFQVSGDMSTNRVVIFMLKGRTLQATLGTITT